ncbi:MAG: hypothetical protein QXR53_03650 [Candidatus Norongarragalinales archaeon]
MGWKELLQRRRVQVVLLAFVIALGLLFLKDFNPATFDAHMGIEFVGGVRVPISLERSVDSETMQSMVDTIKTRINAFGLSQAIVRPLGDKEIIVEIPRADSKVIENIERILREQGKFEAIIDGRQALSGEHVIANAIGGSGGETITNTAGGAQWGLTFAITGEGELFFAQAAKGKRGFPVLMFLDRPENAVLLLNKSAIAGIPQDSLEDVLRKQGDDITLVFAEDVSNSSLQGKTRVVVGKGLLEGNPRVKRVLEESGFSENPESEKKIVVKPDADFVPQSFEAQFGSSVFSWKAIGLRSAPTLQVEPLGQNAITQYSITGMSSGATPEEQQQNALVELRELKSILSGGRLPVTTIVGSYYDVSPSLGRQFLFYSMFALFFAVFAVSLFLTLRYRKLLLILPIVATSIIELVLLLAILGTFGTLDLSAMAGVIAIIGTGVDNQIVITDEFSRKRRENEAEVGAKEKLSRAFFIVFTTAGISIASMFPLFSSGIVEVTGFAVATMLGVILGIAVTRPAYGVVAEELFKQ